GYDFINGDSDPLDDNYHGTHVAGIIGAVGDNGVGIAGVADGFNVELMALKALDGAGSGSAQSIANAIFYAVDNGADVINLSLGTPSRSSSIANALSYADANEVLVVAAAGNSGQDSDVAPVYPAAYGFDNVISVAATNQSNSLASFSNYGATSVDLGAPGVNIASTVPDDGYAYLSGTSMAAPLVAGAAAALLAALPEVVADDASVVRDLLLGSVNSSAALSGRTVTGGILDLAAAARDLVSLTQSFNTAPVANGDAYSLQEDTSLTLSVLGNDVDSDGDQLLVASFTNAQNGDLQLNEDGSFVYTPTANFFGSDRFTYTIEDGRGGSATATVNLSIAAVNDGPKANDDALATPIRGVTTILASDLLGNDTDIDGDSLAIASVANGAGGTVELVGRDLVFTPSPQFSGTGSFNYTVTDGAGGVDTAAATLEIVAPASTSYTVDFEAGAGSLTGLDISNGAISSQFGGSGASLFFSGGASRPQNRYLITPELDLSQGGSVSFDLIFGNSRNGGENADAGEDIALDYSVNGGLTWSRIGLYDTEAYTTWTSLTEVLPDAAFSQATQLRWSQLRSNGSRFDNWGLDNIQIEAGGSGSGDDVSSPNSTSFAEDFSPGLDAILWQEVGNGEVNDRFTGRDAAFFFTGGRSRDSSRFLTTRGLDVSQGGTIEFDLIFGNSRNGGENADSREDVSLGYSLDNGQSWRQITLYDTEDYTSWTTISESIPVAAQSDNTLFRWIQASHSGSRFDNWAVTDISIGA
ncbi:MAG: S8 family serine peptidase, partial [Cyanobacteria bacterium P01_F01_bin.42]